VQAYLLHLITLIALYALLAYSLNLVVGYGGMLVFSHAGFFGIGAYAFALMRIGERPGSEQFLVTANLSFGWALLIAVLAAAIAAWLMGMIISRFRGDVFVFATMSFQMIVYTTIYNATGLTGGAFGLPSIPRPEFLGVRLDTPAELLALVMAVNAAVLPALIWLYRSNFGLRLRAVRDDERAAMSMGINAGQERLVALTISGACAGLAGGLLASYSTYIDPSYFTLRESLFIVSMLLLGGSGNSRGPIIGVAGIVLLPELLRFVGLPAATAANVREIIYAVALIALMYWRPQGVAGAYAVR
jgi:branched-chain amino acid transport system permease protein